MAKQSEEVVPWEDDNLPAMIEPTPELIQAAYEAVLDGKLPPEIGDPNVSARAVAEQIRYAESFDEAFSPGKLKSWQDYTDVPVIVHSFHFNPSTYENQTLYAVVEIGLPETGNMETVSIGSMNVLTQLVKAWEQHWLPFRCVLRANPTSKPGKTALRLEKA